MSTERFNIVIPDYPEHFKLSNARRAEYYNAGDKLPLYIQRRIAKSEVILCTKKDRYKDSVTNEYLVKNKRTAGKPRLSKINGQGIWDGSIMQFTRNTMRNYLHEYFKPFIIRQLPSKIFTNSKDKFLQLEYIFYIPLDNKHHLQDYLNHSYCYMKTFEDALTELQVINDDDLSILRGGYPRVVNVEDETERRLEVKFHFCNNNERIC